MTTATHCIPMHMMKASPRASLKKVPYGALPSYSDHAAQLGRPSAVRAVGMTLNKNPIRIIIPCHRVIGRDGSLTGYAGGLDIKRQLIDLELRTDAGRSPSPSPGGVLESRLNLF